MSVCERERKREQREKLNRYQQDVTEVYKEKRITIEREWKYLLYIYICVCRKERERERAREGVKGREINESD